MLHDLAETASRLLRMIVAAPVAWQTPAQLSESAGMGLEEMFDLIADLDDAGWLAAWEIGSTALVTLSPLAAERLAVRLVPVNRSETMRWAPLGDPEPPAPEPPGRIPGGSDRFDLIADDTPGPEARAIASETGSRLARAILADPDGDDSRIDALPRPTTLVGMALSPWPGPARDPRKSCPGCLGRELPESAYCVVCDRWGLDHLLTVRLRPSAKVARERSRSPFAPLALGFGRQSVKPTAAELAAAKAARKAKHRRKAAAAANAERAARIAKRRGSSSSR